MRDVHADFDAGAASDVGRVRKINEDSFLVRSERGLWAVADGMGGHAGGKLASGIVVETLGRMPPPRDVGDLVSGCATLIGEANSRIYAHGALNGGTIGTTVAILAAQGRRFACIWSGDSRIYLVRDSRIRQLSRDHTEAQELVAQGVLSPEEAKRWPRRNVITRAIGVGDDPELEMERGELAANDAFVLCSDGLTNHVEDGEILAAVTAHAPELAAQALIDLTLARGATDNVTVIVVRYSRRGGTIASLAPAGATWA
jgi:protein phosphatase